MKIVKIQAELVAPPNVDQLRITLLSDTGLAGVAEARLPGRAPALASRLSELVKVLIGTDPFDTEALIDRLLTRAPGQSGDVEATVVSMLEIACRDLVGLALGAPVYRLLGGAVRDRVMACAVDWMPAVRSTDAVTRAARELVAVGFRTMALDPFGPGSSPFEPTPSALREAVRLAEAVRASVGPEVALRVDLDGRFSPAVAVRFIRSLERIDPVAVADPVRPEHLPLLAGVSIAAGLRLNLRDEFFRVLSRRGCDSIRLDLSRCGGFTEARKIAVLAESHGASVSLRNLSGRVATNAALHLAATLTNLGYVEVGPTIATVLNEGALPLPTGPGVGTSLAASTVDLS